MKNSLKLAGISATLLLSLTSLASCGGSSNPNAFKMLSQSDTYLGDGTKWGDKQFFQKMKELTNTDIDFSMVYDSSTYGQKKNTWYLNSDASTWHDFFYKSELSKTYELELGSQDFLIPLEDYLDECCPNLLARMSENSWVRKVITSADGHIYSLPTIHYSGTNPYHTDGYYFINKQWCEDVGVNPDNISTIEELRSVLVKFRDQKNVKYPMYLAGLDEIFNLFGAFGYSIISWNAYLDDNNQVHVAATEEKYRDMMKYFREMYFGTSTEIAQGKRGVINEYFDRCDSSAKRLAIQKGQVGCFIDYSTEVAKDYANQYVAIPALTSASYTGEAFWPGRIGVDNGAFAIVNKWKYVETTDSDYEEKMQKKEDRTKELLRWIDKVYDVETSKWDTIGCEGIDWKYEDESKTTWSFIGDRDSISKNKCVQYGGGLPGVEMSYDGSYQRCTDSVISHSYSEIAKVQSKIKPGVPPQLTLSLAKLKTLSGLSNDIGEKIGDFILQSIVTKNYDVNSYWNSLQTELDRIGVDDYIDLLQEGCDEFFKE